MIAGGTNVGYHIHLSKYPYMKNNAKLFGIND